MKRALRMFGNRLGNCAYDKIFLKDVKNIRPNTSNSSFRPANYPKTSVPNQNVPIYQPQQQPPQQPPQQQPFTVPLHSTSNPQASNSVLQVQNNQKPAAVAPVADENMFENSMMISEEDLIASDENYGVFLQLEESYQREGIYPILPNKRK